MITIISLEKYTELLGILAKGTTATLEKVGEGEFPELRFEVRDPSGRFCTAYITLRGGEKPNTLAPVARVGSSSCLPGNVREALAYSKAQHDMLLELDRVVASLELFQVEVP